MIISQHLHHFVLGDQSYKVSLLVPFGAMGMMLVKYFFASLSYHSRIGKSPSEAKLVTFETQV
jgi:hypothetical protein